MPTGGPLGAYLADPFLADLYRAVREAGPIKPISVDLTHICNLRCQGCYFFEEGMDHRQSPAQEADFDAFIAREKERGTNFVTVVGGEPSLALGRLGKIYRDFWTNVATNGLRRIPREGFETLPIGISVWGDHATDRQLRGGGRRDVFATALSNYRDDPRAFWYYTVAPGHAHEIERVVRSCVDNGNRVLFNFYCDIAGLGGEMDARGDGGFAEVRRQIDRMIERYPDRILMTSYLSQVVTTGRLYDQRWGWDVCTSITADNDINRWRIDNGQPYNPHFRAYNADLTSTRRCCTGEDRDCGTCFDVWEHFAWIMIHLRKHLGSAEEFTRWLTSTYLFYWINRIVDFPSGVEKLPEIHRRVLRSVSVPPPGPPTIAPRPEMGVALG